MKRSSKLEPECNSGIRNVRETRTLKGSIQLQAGLGRPAIYKKRAEVDAALGLRTVTYVASGSRSTWAAYPCALKGQFNSAQWQRPGSTNNPRSALKGQLKYNRISLNNR